MRVPVRFVPAGPADAYLVLAVTLVVVGSGLVAAGPRLPVVAPGAAGAPAFGVWPLLAVLAVTPAVLALVLVLVGQRPAALALVAAVGAAAAGRLVLDLWLASAPWAAARPELWVPAGGGPVGGGPVGGGPGPRVLAAGQACLVLAGVCALAGAAHARGEHGLDPDPHASRVSPLMLPAAVGCAVAAGVGLLAAPFRSADPRLVARSVLEVAGPEVTGGLVLAAALVLAAGLAASAPDHRVVVAGLAGTALAVLGVALPRLVVSALAPGLGVAPGPVMAVVAAIGLAVLARVVSAYGWSAPRVRPERARPHPVAAAALRRSAGLLCLLSGGCAVIACFAPPLRLAADLQQPRLPTVGLLLCTGGVLAIGGWVTAIHPVGRLIRPALAVIAVGMPMSAAEHVTAVLGVLDLPGVDAGPGWWLACAAVVSALGGALAAVLAGGFERDDVDLAELTGRPLGGPVAIASAAAAVLALPGFLLPLVDGAGRGVTGVFQAPFGLPSWALLGGLAVILGVALLGPRCRPVPAAVLYTGGCVLMMLRLARIPFGPRPLPTSGIAEGAWASLLCLVLLLVAATISVRLAQPETPSRPAPPRPLPVRNALPVPLPPVFWRRAPRLPPLPRTTPARGPAPDGEGQHTPA